MHYKGGIFITALLLMQSLAALGHESADSAEVRFRQGHSVLVPDYEGNRGRLDSLIGKLGKVPAADSLFHYSVKRIDVIGGASPEGSVEINRRLSRRRASAIFDYVGARVALPDSLTSFTFLGRDWRGLRQLVADDPAVPYRDETLALLDTIISDIGTTSETDSPGHLRRLKGLRGGVPYRYMYTRLFPALRASTLTVEYTAIPRLLPISLPDLPLTSDAPAFPAPEFPVMTPAVEKKPFYMALKSNLLYDALALPSLGAEFYVGKNYSVVANWTYGWWDTDRTHHYWRAYGGDLAVRRWFGRKAEEKPLTGHHVGVYAGVVTFDFEFGGTGYMAGLPGQTLWHRCLLNAGIEYGYSLPVGRRINIDFTIGLGYLGGRYIKYVPGKNGYLWESTHQLHWVGPTKAEISLVWLIGRGNYNRGKGGKS